MSITRATRTPARGRHTTGKETALFVLAATVIAIHVIDDSFLQPQPGTSAGDHVFSGLIPLALLALAGWAFPRVRSGARGAIALTLVIPAILSGAEGLYYGGKTGLSGDDYTGLLAMAAAPLLLALGVRSLWTSRRLEDHRIRRYGRRTLISAGVLTTAVIVAMPLTIAYIGSHIARADVPAADLGAAHQDVDLHTSDGLKLAGWYVPSRNRAAVIVFPGRSGSRTQTRMLVRHGYGVLLYDRRGDAAAKAIPTRGAAPTPPTSPARLCPGSKGRAAPSGRPSPNCSTSCP